MDVTSPPRRATFEDVLQAPPHQVAEVVDGQLHLWPRPRPRHSFTTVAVCARLEPRFQSGPGGRGGWWILVEPELHLGGDIVVPDLAGWRRARLPAFPEDAFLTLAPDWACEVLTPRTARFDRKDKLAVYAAAGVTNAWLLDPALRTLEVLRRQDGGWLLVGVHGESGEVQAEPFAELSLDLATLWPPTE